MKKSLMAKFKLLLTIFLALTMAFSLIATVACKDNNDDSSSSDTTETITELTDTQTIKNGDFEYGTANTEITSYPVYSSVNWARANGSIGNSSAPSSSNSSGIIDTREYVYEYDEDGYVYLVDGVPQLLEETDDDGNTTNVQLYQAIARNKAGQLPEVKDADGNTVKDADDNTVYYNPRTPSYYALTDYSDEEGSLMGGGKILMINNKYSSETGKGTAQYFSASSEFSLYPGETGKIELWLMTKDLKNPLNTIDEEYEDFGAYIEITTTIGSIATPATRLKNIDTNGEWSKFTFYVEGSNFAQTKLSIKIGLGMGNAIIMKNFVEGYAFIDDVAFTVLEKDQTVPTQTDFSYSLYDDDGDMKPGDDGQKTSYFDKDFKQYIKDNSITIKPNDVEDFRSLFGEYNFLEEDYQARTDYTETTAYVDCTKPELTGYTLDGSLTNLDNAHSKISTYVNTSSVNVVTNIDADGPFNTVKPYTLSFDSHTNVAFETTDFSLDENQNYKISFWVKTALTEKGSGISLYLVDKGTNQTTVDSVETAITEGFVTKKDCNKDYNDWTKFTVIVSNTAKDANGSVATRWFSIKLVVGPTAISDNIYDFPKGEVSISNLTVMDLIKNDDLDEVSSVEKTQDTNVKEVSLNADLQTVNTETETSDSYSFSYSDRVYNISQAPVKEVINYKGVVGNHNRVGVDNGATTDTQANTVAGLINTEFLNNYQLTTDQIQAIKKLEEATLEDSDNAYIQPLMINNLENGISYGYLGSSNTVSAQSTALITLKVKVIGNATAYIYLVNDTDNANFDVLETNVNRQDLIDSTYGEDATRFKNKDTLEQSVNGKYMLALTESDTPGDGYATVSFLIKTGNESITFRLEMWNGIRKDSKDGTEKVANSQSGLVLFDEFSFATSVDYTVKQLEFKQLYGIEYVNATEQLFTQIPSKVLTDDNPEDGEVRVYGDDETAIAFKSGTLFIQSDLSTIYTENEIDEITVEEDEDDSSSEDTDSTEQTSFSPFLYFTSLAVALALIVALLAIVVKHIVTAIKKRKEASRNYYDKNLRQKSFDNIQKSKNQKQTKFKEEYDYDDIESNIIDDESEETVEELDETEELEEVEETDQVEIELSQDAPVEQSEEIDDANTEKNEDVDNQ